MASAGGGGGGGGGTEPAQAGCGRGTTGAGGAATTTRTGNTVYGFSSTITGSQASIYDFSVNKHPILTIFDSSGTDTLNLSGWNTPSIISLESGTFSSCNSMTNNIAIAYGCVIENADLEQFGFD